MEYFPWMLVAILIAHSLAVDALVTRRIRQLKATLGDARERELEATLADEQAMRMIQEMRAECYAYNRWCKNWSPFWNRLASVLNLRVRDHPDCKGYTGP